MKSKLISLNMVTFEMFIFRSISTLVNREDSPTLSKTYLSGPIYFVSGPSPGPSGLSQDHIRILRTTQDHRMLVYRTPGFSGPQEQARTDILQPYPFYQGFTDITCFPTHSMYEVYLKMAQNCCDRDRIT